eukprot:1158433-Pelagomonas_calceolata.AAC.21
MAAAAAALLPAPEAVAALLAAGVAQLFVGTMHLAAAAAAVAAAVLLAGAAAQPPAAAVAAPFLAAAAAAPALAAPSVAAHPIAAAAVPVLAVLAAVAPVAAAAGSPAQKHLQSCCLGQWMLKQEQSYPQGFQWPLHAGNLCICMCARACVCVCVCVQACVEGQHRMLSKQAGYLRTRAQPPYALSMHTSALSQHTSCSFTLHLVLILGTPQGLLQRTSHALTGYTSSFSGFALCSFCALLGHAHSLFTAHLMLSDKS